MTNDLTNSRPIATMQTFSGLYVNPLRPTVTVMDVAHGLAHTFRYGGQSPHPYTVAQHSVNVMRRLWQAYVPPGTVPDKEACTLLMQGLLHDAHEAYIGDWILPLKYAAPVLRDIEDACQAHVLAQFGFSLPLDPRVKEFDVEAMHSERETLWRPDGCHPDRVQQPTLADEKWVWTPNEAKAHFLNAYYGLQHQMELIVREERAAEEAAAAAEEALDGE